MAMGTCTVSGWLGRGLYVRKRKVDYWEGTHRLLPNQNQRQSKGRGSHAHKHLYINIEKSSQRNPSAYYCSVLWIEALAIFAGKRSHEDGCLSTSYSHIV
jgi:hypothetical protein